MSTASASSPAALFFLGASHQTTPIELREKLALTSDKLLRFQATIQGIAGIHEFAIINTCNRVEFYLTASTPTTVAALESAFCQFQDFPPDTFARIRQTAEGPAALCHLVEVASGLKSQMLGETEILGQLKDAYAAAQTHKTVGPTLNRVFQKTFQYAKYVRTHTALTNGQISIANVAVELAQKIFGELTSTRILLLGAGDIGEKTAKAFQSRGAQSLVIASRTLDRAAQLATELAAQTAPLDHALAHVSAYDIVVCSTAATDSLFHAHAVAQEMKKRRDRPLFFIDLSLPRNVAPTVADLDNVFVYNLDDLAKIAERNLAARAAEVDKARQLIREKTAHLWSQINPASE